MKTFFRPQTLLSENRFKAVFSNTGLIQNKHDGNVNSAVIVFSHHRDVKVALDDLRDAGFDYSDRFILMARNAKRYSWHCELTAYNYFDVEEFDCSQADRDFFWRLFQKGKYLLLISGTKYDVDSATRIVARRRGHAEVWHFEELLTN